MAVCILARSKTLLGAYHSVERQMDIQTMMSIGGWSDYSAVEPYLAEPTEARIGEAMET